MDLLEKMAFTKRTTEHIANDAIMLHSHQNALDANFQSSKATFHHSMGSGIQVDYNLLFKL
jgi:hypothetical protein